MAKAKPLSVGGFRRPRMNEQCSPTFKNPRRPVAYGKLVPFLARLFGMGAGSGLEAGTRAGMS